MPPLIPSPGSAALTAETGMLQAGRVQVKPERAGHTFRTAAYQALPDLTEAHSLPYLYPPDC